MDMPGGSGLELLQQLKAEGLEVKVLMFSMLPENQLAVRALRSGASGYLSKNTLDSELINAVRMILNGRKYIAPGVVEQLTSYMENPDSKPPHTLLSDREYQTLLLLAKGKTTSEIASQLSLSPSTVSTFRARLLEKMRMKTTAEAVTYAIKESLV